MEKELNTLATPVPDTELDADETLGSNENTLEEPTAQSEENNNPQTEETDIEKIQTEENPQTEEKDEYNEIWNKDLDEVDIEELSQPEPEQKEEPSEEEPTEEESQEETEVGSEEEKEQPNGVVITRPLKYRGKEIWVKTEEEAIELMQKGLDYSFKMNKIKPLRNIASIIEESGLEPEDVKALADAKQGKAEAIKYLANKFGIETEYEDDIFSEEEPTGEEYKPEVQQEDPIKEYYSDLTRRDPELAGKVSKVWDTLDETFKVELYNPEVFPAFVGSIQTGEFEQVLPEAVKIKALNPALSWIQAYQYAVQNVGSIENKTQEPSSVVKPKRPQKQRKRMKTIEETYDEIWNNKSLEELEKEIFG